MNGKKLMLSKWTAVTPMNKEKHFLVAEIIRDDNGNITGCLLEAVYTGNQYPLDPGQLYDRAHWLPGWQKAEP